MQMMAGYCGLQVLHSPYWTVLGLDRLIDLLITYLSLYADDGGLLWVTDVTQSLLDSRWC